MKMRLLLLPVLLTLAACGIEPEAGDSCSASTGACSSSTEALICESGTLRAVACSGPAGCSVNSSDQVICDFSKAKPGEACPRANESQGECDAANANQLLRCSSGTWTAEACKACALQGSSIICQP